MFANNSVRSVYDFYQKKKILLFSRTKLVFNLAGLAIAAAPFDVDMPTCKGIIFSSIIGNFLCNFSCTVSPLETEVNRKEKL